MNTTEPTEHQNKLAEFFQDCAFTVHREFGPGLLENFYEECLASLLMDRNIPFERQKAIPAYFMNKKIEVGYKADFIIDNCLIVELKSVESLKPIHQAQVITYMKISNINLGLLINFNVKMLREGIKRMVYSQDS